MAENLTEVIRVQLEAYSGDIYGLLEFGRPRTAIEDAANAIAFEVLDFIGKHLSAVQYDPAPYTALKHRLAMLKETK